MNNQIEKQESRHETTIEFYRKELQERSKLLENQQVLALESNKKIQKLENQLEEERQLNYSFDTSSNDRQNVNAQEATFTEESKDNNQQQEENQTTDKDIDPKVIFEENRNEDINQSTNAKENERVEKQDPNTNDEIERPSKRDFGVACLVTNSIKRHKKFINFLCLLCGLNF